MTEYDEDWTYPVVFPPKRPAITIAQVIADRGLEAAARRRDGEVPARDVLLQRRRGGPVRGRDPRAGASPRDVPTYDHKPEMSAREAADAFVRHWRDDEPAFAIINFANPDMVGHTGVIEAAVKAVETVDECLGEVVEAVHASGGACVITADHGNCDHMLEEDGSLNTAHSLNPVPFIVTADGAVARRRGHPRRRRADRARAARDRAARADDGPLAARVGWRAMGEREQLRARDVLLGGPRDQRRRGGEGVLQQRVRLGGGRHAGRRRGHLHDLQARRARRGGAVRAGRGGARDAAPALVLVRVGRRRRRARAARPRARRRDPGRAVRRRVLGPHDRAARSRPARCCHLWQPREQRGAGRVNDPGCMVWNELASPDPAPRARLLRRAARLDDRAGGVRLRRSSGSTARSTAACGRIQDGEPAHWLVYFTRGVVRRGDRRRAADGRRLASIAGPHGDKPDRPGARAVARPAGRGVRAATRARSIP